MDAAKRARLESMGGRVSTVAEFLGLSPHEEAMVETGLILSNLVRDTREDCGWTQKQLATRLGIKTSEVAKLEVAPGTSFALLFQALFLMGVTPREIGAALSEITLELRSPEPIAA